MHEKRLGVGVVVVNRLLYAIGGFDGNQRLASVECYHPENNEWSYLQPMSCGRSGAGVATINQFIYIVGGFDGNQQLNLVERYDTENQLWEQMAPIQTARSALSLTSLDGKLYAIGGFDGINFLSIVEVYDPKTNLWEKGTPLSSGRSGHASAVIYQPSGASNFPLDTIQKESSNNDDDGCGEASGQRDFHQTLFSSSSSVRNQPDIVSNSGTTLPQTSSNVRTTISTTRRRMWTTVFNQSRNLLEQSEQQSSSSSSSGGPLHGSSVLYVPRIIRIDSFDFNGRPNSRLLNYMFLLSEAIMERCTASKRHRENSDPSVERTNASNS